MSDKPVPRKHDIAEALAYADVLIRPRHSNFVPSTADTKTMFSRRVPLNIPFSSAAMDRVTESRFAIALARMGGIGVIHKNMSIKMQADEVDRVKRSESGMITSPVTVTADRPLSVALELMARYRISGVPVINERGKLIGILTNRDLRLEKDHTRTVSELMTQDNLVIAPVGTGIREAEEIFRTKKVEKLPIVDDEGKLCGLITFKDIQNRSDYPMANKDEEGRLLVAAGIGATKDYLDRAEALVANGVDAIVIDTAHGDSENVFQAVREVKKRFDKVDVVAGNVASGDAVRQLIDCGADAVKIGVGAGSICTTRIVAGAGIPMITAILDCYGVALESNVPIIADGGIEETGDVVKAIAAGACSVMIGSKFAGTDETPGEIVIFQGQRVKEYRGMGSVGAMRLGSADRYGQQDLAPDKTVPEGVEGYVPLRGPLADVLHQYVGGLKQGMGYAGCSSIEELRNLDNPFVRITSAGIKESHVHGIHAVKESPNYQVPR